MPKLNEYPFLKKLIDQWPQRARKAHLKHKEVAELAEMSEEQFSLIINGKVKNPRMSTIDKVERVLESKGV